MGCVGGRAARSPDADARPPARTHAQRPQIQQEVGRLALQALASSAIYAIGSDGDNPVFLPQIGQVLNVGQPNATPATARRASPRRHLPHPRATGSLRMVNVGQLGPGPGEQGAGAAHPGPTRVYHDINALHVDDQGRFDVILSPQRPQAIPATGGSCSPPPRSCCCGW